MKPVCHFPMSHHHMLLSLGEHTLCCKRGWQSAPSEDHTLPSKVEHILDRQ